MLYSPSMSPRRKWIVASTGGAAALGLGLVMLLRAAPPAGPGSASAAEPRPEDRATAVRWVQFEGACDASGAVPVDERHFAVADDEDNVLRVYDAFAGGPPVRRTNLSKQLALAR